MIIDLVNNIAIEEFKSNTDEMNYDKMLNIFDKKILILKKGILIGDWNVWSKRP